MSSAYVEVFLSCFETRTWDRVCLTLVGYMVGTRRPVFSASAPLVLDLFAAELVRGVF